jgi:uncharacterized membrane protein
VRILEVLTRSEQTVGQIALALQSEPSLISKHLQVLHHAGLVGRRREANTVRYWISSPRMSDYLRYLAAPNLPLASIGHTGGVVIADRRIHSIAAAAAGKRPVESKTPTGLPLVENARVQSYRLIEWCLVENEDTFERVSCSIYEMTSISPKGVPVSTFADLYSSPSSMVVISLARSVRAIDNMPSPRPARTSTAEAPPTPSGHAVSENVQRISDLEAAARRELTRSERISKAVTDFAGSLRFVVLHVVVFGGWALWNMLLPGWLRFDPYPFGLMTMLVSLEGVFLATFVLITQNRMMMHTERRDHLGLQVSMLTEQELTITLRMLRQLCENAGIPRESEQQQRVEDLMQETNVYEVMQRLDEELPKD